MNTSRILNIKGHIIGDGIPIICVPVTGKNAEEIIKNSTDVVKSGAQMIEWRADSFERLSDFEVLHKVLDSLKNICTDTILLFTIRSVREGGECVLSQKDIEKILFNVAELNIADLIDFEYHESDAPAEAIRRIKGCGAKVVASYHDFRETPCESKIISILSEMEDGGADICKIAVMPGRFEDTLTLMKAGVEFNRLSKKNYIAIAMGEMGKLSRVAGRYTESCITFATIGEGSAPGQLDFDNMETVLELLK